MQNELLEQVTVFKYLGVLIDNRLNFNAHVDQICKKSKMSLGAIGRVRCFITKSIALNLYKSLVLPYIDYAAFIYQHTSAENLARVQMIQNNACRLITRNGKYASVVGMHMELELRMLVDRRLFQVSVFMYKFIEGHITDRNILDMFRTLEHQHGRNTRAQARKDMIVPVCRTKMGERAFSIYGAKIWNSLLLETRESNTVETFTRRYWLTHREVT